MNDSSGKKPRHVLTLVLIPVLIIVAFVWLLQFGKAPRHLMAQRDCENRYAQARTAAESTEVDSQEPLVQSRGRDTIPLTCGSLGRGDGIR